MPDNSWPIDALGNPIRKGDLIRLTLLEPALYFRVIEVSPAGTLVGPDNQPMSLRGAITVQAVLRLDYNPDAMIDKAVVVKEPETTPKVTQ